VGQIALGAAWEAAEQEGIGGALGFEWEPGAWVGMPWELALVAFLVADTTAHPGVDAQACLEEDTEAEQACSLAGA